MATPQAVMMVLTIIRTGMGFGCRVNDVQATPRARVCCTVCMCVQYTNVKRSSAIVGAGT